MIIWHRTLHLFAKSAFFALTIPAWMAVSGSSASGQSNFGPPVKRFQLLTDEIYATTDHHTSDALSFPNYYEWKRKLSEQHGVDFVVLNTPIFQVGSVGEQGYADNELDVYFQWRAFENERTAGKLFFWGLWVQTFTDLPSGAFAASQGLLSFPNGGATDPGKSVVAPSALWWEQTFFKTGLTYRLGQLYAASLFGANDHLGDDRATFMNTVLGTNNGAPWSSGNRGLGAMLTWGGKHGYLSFGFQDAKGDQISIDFDSFADGHFAYLAEAGITPEINGLKGRYNFTIGYVDETAPGGAASDRSGWGYILSAQQHVTDTVSLFGIYRGSKERIVNNAEATAGLGLIVDQPFGWKNDKFGFGAFYQKPFDKMGGAVRDEYGIEAFYNYQLTPRLSISPDIQVYLQPGRTQQSGTPVVVGFRLQYVL